MKTVLFLCTGNYYRSRFAEEMFNFLAPAECLGWRAASRGIAADRGVHNVGPIARSTADALHRRGVVFDRAAARAPLQLEVDDLDCADHIVALKEAEHLPMMRERFPAWLDRNDPQRIEYWRVHDIDGMTPEQALPLIANHLQELMKRLSRGLTSADPATNPPPDRVLR